MDALQTHSTPLVSRPPRPAKPVRVYDYLDFRLYLKAFYEATKRSSKGRFSYRVFSNKTGVDSPNYMKLIVDGQRSLTPAHAKRVARYCALDASEAAFFLTLVKWNQSKSIEEQSRLWNELLILRAKSGFQQLSTSQLAVITDLRLVALFELLQLESSDGNSERLAARLSLPMSADEVRAGLATLEAAQLIKVSGSKVRIISKTLKTADDVPSKSVRHYHNQAMTAAKLALEKVPVEQREFISTTISLPKSRSAEVKALLRETRDKLLSLSENSAHADSVFQINFQFFPLTNSNSENS